MIDILNFIIFNQISYWTGLVWIIYYFFKFTYEIFITFICPGFNIYKRYKGGWAVITGATDGLGLAYSF